MSGLNPSKATALFAEIGKILAAPDVDAMDALAAIVANECVLLELLKAKARELGAEDEFDTCVRTARFYGEQLGALVKKRERANKIAEGMVSKIAFDAIKKAREGDENA